MPRIRPIPRIRWRSGLPALTATMALAVVVLPSPAATAATKKAPASRPLDVSAGGTYRVAAGAPVTLQATYAVAGQTKTVADLRAIGSALAAYENANGTYPPAALRNDAGVATVSWRVLLLPYLGFDDLYKKFDLTKPWNDPVNAPLLKQMPSVFRGAGASKGATTTGYAGVAGSKQLFQSAQPGVRYGVRREWVTDGVDMTIAVGPVGRDVKVPWTSPGDIEIATTPALGTPKGFDGPGSFATPMLFLDGVVRPIPDITETNNMTSWSTIAGGGCAPPSGLEVQLTPQWDLDGSGQFATINSVVTIPAVARGTRTFKFRVVDDLGGTHIATAKVVAQ